MLQLTWGGCHLCLHLALSHAQASPPWVDAHFLLHCDKCSRLKRKWLRIILPTTKSVDYLEKPGHDFWKGSVLFCVVNLIVDECEIKLVALVVCCVCRPSGSGGIREGGCPTGANCWSLEGLAYECFYIAILLVTLKFDLRRLFVLQLTM